MECNDGVLVLTLGHHLMYLMHDREDVLHVLNASMVVRSIQNHERYNATNLLNHTLPFGMENNDVIQKRNERVRIANFAQRHKRLLKGRASTSWRVFAVLCWSSDNCLQHLVNAQAKE